MAHKPEEMKAWGKAHRAWMQSIWMEQPAQRVVLQEDLAKLDHQNERVARLDAAMHAQVETLPEAIKQVVGALQCLYGVAELSAVTVVAETGDLGRFHKAPQLFSYAGMVPSEHSSGGPGKERRGGITKAGNAHLRKIVVESAWHDRRPPKVSSELRRRRAGQDAVVIELANKAHRRLHDTYRGLVARGKPTPRAAVAVGRELLGFMWAIAQRTQAQAHASSQASRTQAARKHIRHRNRNEEEGGGRTRARLGNGTTDHAREFYAVGTPRTADSRLKYRRQSAKPRPGASATNTRDRRLKGKTQINLAEP
jgi:transposase